MSVNPSLLVMVRDATNGDLVRVTGEEASLLEALWRTVPPGDQVTSPGVARIRRELGWSVRRFDRVRYGLHAVTADRIDLLHELHRPEYTTRDGQVRADRQPFALHPLVRLP